MHSMSESDDKPLTVSKIVQRFFQGEGFDELAAISGLKLSTIEEIVRIVMKQIREIR